MNDNDASSPELIQPARLIRLHFLNGNPAITVRQYEDLLRELSAREASNDSGLGESILAWLLDDNRHRYDELKKQQLIDIRREELAHHLLLDISLVKPYGDSGTLFKVCEAIWEANGVDSFTFKLKEKDD